MKTYGSYTKTLVHVSLVVLLLACLWVAFQASPTQAESAGWALEFDGTTDFVSLGSVDSIMGPTWEMAKTVQLWVKPIGTQPDCVGPDVSTCDAIFGTRPRWFGIYIGKIVTGPLTGQDRIWVWSFETDPTPHWSVIGIPYTPDQWVNIALVHGGGLFKAYKNGVLVNSLAADPTGNAGGMDVYFGGVIIDATENLTFRGQIDEIRIFDRALSDTEVSQNLYNTIPGNTSGLRAYYQMLPGPPSLTVSDDSGNGWTGMLSDGMGAVPPDGDYPQWVTSDAFTNPAPTVTINKASGQTDPTNTSPVTFDVVFSESVTGFTASDVNLSASTAPGTLSAVVSGPGPAYTVSVSGMTGSGDVVASIPAGAAQDPDGYGNLASTSTDNIVAYDITVPTVTINQAPGQADPTNASPIAFQVVFSEAVTGFIGTDVTLSGTAGPTTAVVSGGPATYTVSVSGMSGNGTVIAAIQASKAQDLAGNNNSASTSTDNTVTYDTVGPTVTIDQAAGQADPTNASPINFTVVFNEAVTGFTGSDVSLGGSAGATTAGVTGSGPTYNVAVSGMSGNGTVSATIAAGRVQDLAGNNSSASTSTDNTVSYNASSPSVTINQAVGQPDPTNVLPIAFDVVFTESVTGFTIGDVTFSGTAGVTTAVLSGSGTTYSISVTVVAHDGTVIASIPAGVAVDGTGDGNIASTSTDNTVSYITVYPNYLPIINR